MKRTPLKRGTPLARKSAKRKTSDNDVWLPARAAVMKRCEVFDPTRNSGDLEPHLDHAVTRYRCECCENTVAAIEVHHAIRRSQGGTHDLSNLHGLCFRCHTGVHDRTHPDWRKFLRRRNGSLYDE